MRRYRILHFVPDPFTGAQFPIAAIAERIDGGVEIVRPASTPNPTCVGGIGRAMLVRAALGDLAGIETIERLPSSLGPQVIATDLAEIPADVDARTWLADGLFPAPVVDPVEGDDDATSIRTRRASEGMRFFENYGIGRYIRKQYRPPTTAARLFGPISHYVQGRSETLLMEPISFRRSKAADEFRSVARILAAYRATLRDTEQTTLLGYFLAGGPADERTRAIHELGEVVQVVDTAVPRQRDELIDRIRAVGTTGDVDLA